MHTIVIVTAAFGLIFTLVFEVIQVFPKVAGSINSLNGLGANSALRLLIFNRVGAVLYFPSIGYLVDSGSTYSLIAAIGIASVSIYLLMVYLLYSRFGHFLQLSSIVFFKERISVEIFKDKFHIKFLVLSAVAGTFSMLGLIIPMLLGTIFSEYRLTLANMGFVFNSVFTLLTVYVIDKELAILCDKKSDDLIPVARSMLIGRSIGSVVVLCVLFVLIVI